MAAGRLLPQGTPAHQQAPVAGVVASLLTLGLSYFVLSHRRGEGPGLERLQSTREREKLRGTPSGLLL